MLVDYNLTPRVTRQLERWQADGTISGYAIAPGFEDTLRQHLFMARYVRRLRRMNFEYFVSITMMQVWERYLISCALPPKAVRLGFYTQMSNLLGNEALFRSVLEGKPQEAPATTPAPAAGRAAPLSPLRALRRLATTPGLGGRMGLLARYARFLWSKVPRPSLSISTPDFSLLFDRTLLPALLVGKTFPLGKHDRFTQIGTDQFDALAFLDPVDARAHAALYGNPNMFVVEHPAKGNCRCGTDGPERHAILSPLSGLMGRDTVPPETLESYRRDLGTALRESGAREIHLRLHPSETGKWPQRLVEFLGANGIPARIVDAALPIREVICDYAGVVGYASAALRDGRGCCDYAFVVGMVAASKSLFANPKLLFGDSEGIDWIEEDGTHAPGIFERRRYVPPPYPSLMDLLTELKQRKMPPARGP